MGGMSVKLRTTKQGMLKWLVVDDDLRVSLYSKKPSKFLDYWDGHGKFSVCRSEISEALTIPLPKPMGDCIKVRILIRPEK